MSIKGFSVGGVVQRYDYTALDNLPRGQGVSDDLKEALLQLASKVAYIDDQGQTYYDDLYNALYPEKTLLSITANFNQGQAVVYNTDSLDSLKQYLTVTAVYDDASTETVPSSDYTLSGTLTAGTSVITVTYEGKTDAFGVTVTAAPMAITVTNNLTGCTTSNSATSVLENTAYNAVITASNGYSLVGATVSITMGGQDITTSAYSGGIITINSVTGALVISVAAVARILSSISAVYTQSGTVYDTDTLDSLKNDLVVTAIYSDSTTQIIPAANYTLSGTLTAGTSTITVSYSGMTTTFSVTVTSGLDRIAYGTLTYRDIFITNNIFNRISDFETAFTISTTAQSLGDGWYVKSNAGSPVLSTDASNTPTHSLKAFGTSSTQIAYYNETQEFAAGKYIVCASVKTTRYTKGNCGAQAGWPYTTAANFVQAVYNTVSSDFHKVAKTITLSASMTGFRGFIGTMNSANADCYVDDVVCSPVPSGMTEEEALTLYSDYLAMKGV